jgi:cytoskeletal protein RodZ
MQPTSNENSVGPVVAIIIVLALVILGGLYFWGQRGNNTETNSNTTATTQESEVTASIESQSSSDASADIESDLNNTNVTNLDAGLNSGI